MEKNKQKPNNKTKNEKYWYTEEKEAYKDYTNKSQPEYLFLSGAQHHKLDPENGVWQPSDEAVEEMRDYSIENKL